MDCGAKGIIVFESTSDGSGLIGGISTSVSRKEKMSTQLFSGLVGSSEANSAAATTGTMLSDNNGASNMSARRRRSEYSLCII